MLDGLIGRATPSYGGDCGFKSHSSNKYIEKSMICLFGNVDFRMYFWYNMCIVNSLFAVRRQALKAEKKIKPVRWDTGERHPRKQRLKLVFENTFQTMVQPIKDACD